MIFEIERHQISLINVFIGNQIIVMWRFWKSQAKHFAPMHALFWQSRPPRVQSSGNNDNEDKLLMNL